MAKEKTIIHHHYNITATRVNKDCPGDNIDTHVVKKRERKEIPGWMHINPISTQIDLQSVADQLSDYKFTPGLKVTVDDLLHPEYMEYEATPKKMND